MTCEARPGAQGARGMVLNRGGLVSNYGGTVQNNQGWVQVGICYATLV